jgi:MFS family permease
LEFYGALVKSPRLSKTHPLSGGWVFHFPSLSAVGFWDLGKTTMNPNPPTTLRVSLAALPREAYILFLGTFLNKFGTFVLPFLAIYMTRQGYTAWEAGLALGSYGAGHLLAAGLGGYLADRVGRRPTIILSMFSAAAAMLALSQARHLTELVVFAGLTGLAGELYRPAATALLADVVPPEHRITAFAAYRLAFNAGWAFGPATAGILVQHSYTWLFLGDAATSVLYGLVAWIALPSAHRPERKTGSGWVFLKTVRADWRFMQLLGAVLLVGLVFMQICSTLSLALADSGMSSRVYGLLISLNGLLVVLFELPITRMTRLYPPRSVIATGFLLIGLGFALNSVVHQTAGFVIVICLFTVGEMISMPVAGAYVADLAPPHWRGRYMGVFGFMWALALVVGPPLGTWLFSYNPAWLWLACGVLGLLSSALMLLNPGSDPAYNRKRYSLIKRMLSGGVS